MKKIIIDQKEQIRIDKFLSIYFSDKNITRGLIQKYIKDGSIKVNNKVITKNSYLLKFNDVLNINVDDDFLTKKLTLVPWDNEKIIDIIEETKDFVIINKPIQIIMHPAHGNWDKTLANILISKFSELDLNLINRPGIVHRLDKDTTGVLIISKNSNFTTNIQKQFQERTIKKTYVAFVEGKVDVLNGTIIAPIGNDPKNFRKMEIDGINSKEATTEFRLIKAYEKYSLVAFFPKTGRTHQIRLHAKFIGHPILNDELYGEVIETKKEFGQYLHAYKISFTNIEGSREEFKANFPEEFYEIEPNIDKLMQKINAKT